MRKLISGQLWLKRSKHWDPLLLKEWGWSPFKGKVDLLGLLDSSPQRIWASLKVWEPDPRLLKESPVAVLLILASLKSCNPPSELLKELTIPEKWGRWFGVRRGLLGREMVVVVVSEGVETTYLKLCKIDLSSHEISRPLRSWEPDPLLMKEASILGLLIMILVKSCDPSWWLMKDSWIAHFSQRLSFTATMSANQKPLLAFRGGGFILLRKNQECRTRKQK